MKKTILTIFVPTASRRESEWIARWMQVGLLVLLTIGAPYQAQAIIVHWSLSGVTFNDGGSASGSFLYDADTQSLTGFDVTTTAGTSLPGHHYLDLTGDFPPYPAIGFAVTDPSMPPLPANAPFLALGFSSPLSNAGGNVALIHGSGEGFCLDTFCQFGSYRRSFTGGSVIGSVPEPATLALLSLALAVGFARRRKLR